jgi:hypothetical protein
MAPPNGEQIRLMQMLGLATMALIFGVRVVPPLQPYAGRIGKLAVGLYLLVGLGLLAWYFIAR